MTGGRSPLPSPTPGEMFGRYLIVRALGEGGMGLVYEAEHPGLGKRVALKTLRPSLADDAEVVARFLREGMAAARIRHPNVVDVTDVGTERGLPYLVMEMLDGETLGALVERGPLDPEAVAALLLPVCAAVAAAHARGVLHRDLKPDNVLLARTPHGPAQPKVLDFGIAKILGEDASLSLTSTAAVLGTPFYMSPEQARGARDLDARADQYALGVMLYECATGQKPFQASSLLALAAEITNGTLRPPRALRPELSEDFEAVVLRAMARNPDGRFPSVRALGAALLPLADDRTQIFWEDAFLGEPEPPPSVPPARPPTPRAAHVAVALMETVSRPRITTEAPRSARVRWVIAVVLAVLVVGFAVHRLATSAPPPRQPLARPAPPPVVAVPVAPAVTPVPPAVDASAVAPVVPSIPPLVRPVRVLVHGTPARRPPPAGPREIPME